MTVHCVQFRCSTDVDRTNVENKINDLKLKYGERLPEQNWDLEERTTIDGGVTFLDANFRLSLGKDAGKLVEKDDMLEQVRKEADKSASWWQLRWHECTHDDDKRPVEKTRELPDGTTETYTDYVKGCDWQDVRKSDASVIPDEVEF